MRHTFVAFLLPFVACAHTPRPVTFAFGSVECRPQRSVMCVGEGPHCDALVHAVSEINAAIGHTLLRFDGSVAKERAFDAMLAGVFVLDQEELPPGVLGQTGVHQWSHCISVSYTNLSPALVAGLYGTSVSLEGVVLHEVIHALGGGHSDAPGRSFGSVMAPAVSDPDFSPILSPLDAATLHSVYGN